MGSFCSSWFPAQTLMLQVSLVLGSQTVKDASPSCTLERIVGQSVQLQLNSSVGPNIREIEWNWNSEHEKEQILVSWKPDTRNPEWYEIEEKYRSRFNLTEMAFLSMRNLTMEMSGLYTAKIKFRSGKSQEEVFKLCLYEPVPQPQIQIHAASSVSGRCNISLECRTPGATEDLQVTWLSTGLPRELEQRETLGPAPSSRNLTLSWLLSQSVGRLTCLVCNPVDQKNATLQLEDICSWRVDVVQPEGAHHGERHPSVQSSGPVYGDGCIIRDINAALACGSTLLPEVPGSAAAPQAFPAEGSASTQTDGAHHFYAEIGLLRYTKNDMKKCSWHAHSPECSPAVHTVYEKIRTSPGSQEDT
ncbi:hypothetical protein MC885_017356 [Smutsia gigantea]|nr:hypothetical protein MC885_017356 [Smutsia gigantea]